MCLVLGSPGVESGGHSYCCDFGIIKYHDKALILPDFLLMKTIQEIETKQYYISTELNRYPEHFFIRTLQYMHQFHIL